MANILVTYVPTNTTQPIQVDPPNLRVSPGSNLITWEAVNCTFSPTTGIVFTPTSSAPAIWPNPAPSLQSDGTYQTTDSHHLTLSESAIEYNYNVTIVTLTPNHTRHTRFDPDVTNTPE